MLLHKQLITTLKFGILLSEKVQAKFNLNTYKCPDFQEETDT